MHAFSRWMALATLLSGVAAHADRNDLRIANLGNPDPEGAGFSATANSDFQAFSRAFAASLTSASLMPPESLGHAAFNVNAELSVISLPGDIRIPMEGEQPGTVLVPSLHVRKGLPFSVELGGRVGWVERSRMVAATGEVKWAIHEGFTVVQGPEEKSPLEKLIQYTPNIGVRGHITRLMGVRDFNLTAAGIDLGVGKQFPVGGMVTFTPYGGLDFTFVGADSDRLDFRPERPYNESLQEDSLGALRDTGAYKRVGFSDNMTQRIYGGVRFIGGVLQLGAELSVTRLGNVPLDPNNPNSESRGLPSVFAFNTSLGLDF
jgi:hypothetical protein